MRKKTKENGVCMKKRGFAVFLAAAMLLALCAFASATGAAREVSLVLSQESGEAGDVFRLDVILDDSEGLRDFNYALVLSSLQDIELTDDYIDADWRDGLVFSAGENRRHIYATWLKSQSALYVFSICDGEDSTLTAAQNLIGSFYFRVKDGAQPNQTTISFANATVRDEDGLCQTNAPTIDFEVELPAETNGESQLSGAQKGGGLGDLSDVSKGESVALSDGSLSDFTGVDLSELTDMQSTELSENTGGVEVSVSPMKEPNGAGRTYIERVLYPDANIGAEINLRNHGEQTETLHPYAALYFDGQLQDAKTQTYELDGGQTATYHPEFYIPAEDFSLYEVKFFVWDAETRPLTETVTLNGFHTDYFGRDFDGAARVLRPDSLVEGRIEWEGAADFLKFQPEKDGYYIFESFGDTDMILDFFDKAHGLDMYYVDNKVEPPVEPDDYNFYLRVFLDFENEYYIKLMANGTGDYQMKITYEEPLLSLGFEDNLITGAPGAVVNAEVKLTGAALDGPLNLLDFLVVYDPTVLARNGAVTLVNESGHATATTQTDGGVESLRITMRNEHIDADGTVVVIPFELLGGAGTSSSVQIYFAVAYDHLTRKACAISGAAVEITDAAAASSYSAPPGLSEGAETDLDAPGSDGGGVMPMLFPDDYIMGPQTYGDVTGDGYMTLNDLSVAIVCDALDMRDFVPLDVDDSGTYSRHEVDFVEDNLGKPPSSLVCPANDPPPDGRLCFKELTEGAWEAGVMDKKGIPDYDWFIFTPSTSGVYTFEASAGFELHGELYAKKGVRGRQDRTGRSIIAVSKAVPRTARWTETRSRRS
jgi:hypothetical protein